MKNLLLVILLLSAFSGFSQERYIGLTRDSIANFHSKNFETVTANDTSVLVKLKRDGTTWRYFRFDESGKCVVTGWEVSYYNDFTDLEKKMGTKKFKKGAEVEYNFVASKPKGQLYTNGKETYILMYKAINPNMSATTRGVVYYKTK